MMYTWQQIKGIKNNKLGLKASQRGRNRVIMFVVIPLNITKRCKTKNIYKCP